MGYSLFVSGVFAGVFVWYSGVFSGYSRPGAFENHWVFHISALDLSGPSDSHILLIGKIKHFINVRLFVDAMQLRQIQSDSLMTAMQTRARNRKEKAF